MTAKYLPFTIALRDHKTNTAELRLATKFAVTAVLDADLADVPTLALIYGVKSETVESWAQGKSKTTKANIADLARVADGRLKLADLALLKADALAADLATALHEVLSARGELSPSWEKVRDETEARIAKLRALAA